MAQNSETRISKLPMIFDKFCSFVERHYSPFNAVARESKLFVFNKIPHEFLKKNAQMEYKKHEDIFAIPFPITAIEDPASLIILMDEEEGQLGFGSRRKFIEVIPLLVNETAFSDGDPDFNPLEAASASFNVDPASAVTISFGHIENGRFTEDGSYMEGAVERIIFADKNKVHYNLKVSEMPREHAKVIYENGIRNVFTALEEILAIYTKDSFVFEEQPVTTKPNKNKKILRSHQRPLFTILKPVEIRTKLQINTPHSDTPTGRSSPIAHERRRHPRRLVSEKGYFKKDKIVVIPATWIGESEKRIGNKFYRVRLDV